MKYLLTIIILTFVYTIPAQTISELQKKAKDIKANKDVTINYDKFKDQTVIRSKPYNVIGAGERVAIAMGKFGHDNIGRVPLRLFIHVIHSFPGDKLTATPEKVDIRFTSDSGDWVFLKGDRNLYLLSGGERKVYKPLASDSDITYSGSVTEWLAFEMDVEDLKTLLKAETVEFRLGNTPPRKFKPEVVERILKFVQLVTVN